VCVARTTHTTTQPQDKYYTESHAVIYVVDAANRSRWEESKRAFERMLGSPQLAGAPVLLMANKQVCLSVHAGVCACFK